ATMTYDPSGNLLSKVDGQGTHTFAYDAADELREVNDAETGRSEVYWYQNGERILTYRSGGGQPAALRHRFGTTEIVIDANGATQARTTDIALGGHAVARVSNGDAGHAEYMFNGALGSLLAVVSSSGEGTARFGYGPYGEMLYAEGNEALSFDRKYEGK